MSLLISALSLALGAIVFIKLIGPDAWLIRGLKSDSLGAVVVFCSILACGILMFLLLRFSVYLLPNPAQGDSAVNAEDLTTGYAQGAQVWDAFVCLMSFCIPILTGYLLSVVYRGAYRVVKRFAPR